MPGKQDICIPLTIVIGIIGSFVGGFLGYVLFHKHGQDGFLQPSGIIASVIASVIVLLVWTKAGDARRAPVTALPELVERLARQRLVGSAE